ncbi:glycosyltransferase [Aureitalea sp. L0-47]|uniref:glycosyltransferase family 2 protein n=1 Tax=Aureitalea sp. L0-47 TaxID=2816962 RepID=UPI0022377288|nr:glycosyltransferase family 2 protein [Aureitalea sp. L0-47]MCW5519183.1 glycosyltransferase [Aureitalea sp. L0-47]
MPKISVVTVNYNNANGLSKTIQSVLAQDLDELEYIVIDGGSEDKSTEVIKSFESSIDHWISESDSGVYEAMNKGIDRASGEYVLFLNSGDEFFTSETLKKVLPQLDSGKDIYYGNLIFIHKLKEMSRDYPKSMDFEYFLERSLPHPGSFIRRSLFDTIFRYSEHFRIVSDWEFFIVAILKEKVSYKHLHLVISRFELDGMSNDPKNKQGIEEERFEVIKKHFPERLKEYWDWRKIKEKEMKKAGKVSLVSRVKRKINRLKK